MVRDQDGFIYIREHEGCLMAGGYELVAKPLFDDEQLLGKILFLYDGAWQGSNARGHIEF